MIDAKIVTAIRGDFAMAGYPGKTAEDQVDSFLGDSRLMIALKAAAPARYGSLRSSYVEAMRRSVSYDEFSSFNDATTNAVMNDYLIEASDALVLEFATASVTMLRTAVAKNPSGCRLVPDGAGGYNLHIEPGSGVDYTHLGEIAAHAITDGAARHAPAPGRDAIDTSQAALHLAFRARHADEVEVMGDLGSAKFKAGAACAALADYLETSFTLPTAEAIAFLRYNYSSATISPRAQPSVTDLRPRPRGSKQSD